MYSQVKYMLDMYTEQDPSEWNNMKFVIKLRNRLGLLLGQRIDLGEAKQFANRVACGMSVSISDEVTDEQIEELVEPITTIILKITNNLLDHDFDMDSILVALSKSNLELSV
jgi:hypothetical protein